MIYNDFLWDDKPVKATLEYSSGTETPPASPHHKFNKAPLKKHRRNITQILVSKRSNKQPNENQKHKRKRQAKNTSCSRNAGPFPKVHSSPSPPSKTSLPTARNPLRRLERVRNSEFWWVLKKHCPKEGNLRLEKTRGWREGRGSVSLEVKVEEARASIDARSRNDEHNGEQKMKTLDDFFCIF